MGDHTLFDIVDGITSKLKEAKETGNQVAEAKLVNQLSKTLIREHYLRELYKLGYTNLDIEMINTRYKTLTKESIGEHI